MDAEGIRPTQEHVEGIVKAPKPSNVGELKSWLGMINYYHGFLENLSSRLKPLYKLLQKDVRWFWSKECDLAFEQCKTELLGDTLLVHYDVTKPLVLACDASSYGIGAVLSHVIDGQERPIAMASRTLTKSEQGYSQIEKEALGIVFGVKKFHSYLYGRRFVLHTDHKPLCSILNPSAAIPPIAAARMQRWALLLSAYQYEIKFRKTNDHCNADCMSRLPVASTVVSDFESAVYFFNVE